MPKLAIFDLDGTLIHFPFSYLFDETLRILKLLGHPEVARVDLEESFSSFDYFRVVNYDLKVGWQSEEDFQAKFWAEFDWENYPPAVPLEGVLSSLERLVDSGFSCAIATARACPEEEVVRDLKTTGILPYVSLIKTRKSEKDNWRDKTSQIKSSLDELNFIPQNAIMIGDVPSDIESAKNTFLSASYALLTGGIREEVLRGSMPTAVFSNIEKLVDFLLNK